MSLDSFLASYSNELIDFVNDTKYYTSNRSYWVQSSENACTTLMLEKNRSNSFSYNGSCDYSLHSFMCKKASNFRCNRLCKLTNGMCRNQKCICYEGWTGENCEQFVCFNDCSDRGKCVGPNQCSCRQGWTGKFYFKAFFHYTTRIPKHKYSNIDSIFKNDIFIKS